MAVTSMNKLGLVNRICAYNKALNDPNRMKLMKILGSNADNPLTVSQIAEILRISQPTATKHLQILFDVGLIERRRVANAIFYSLNIENVKEYHNLLAKSLEMAFRPCHYGYICDACPYAETCN